MSRGAIELLRGRGHDAVLQRLLPMVHDLQGLSVEELAVEVRAYVDSLRTGALSRRRRIGRSPGSARPAS